MTGYRTALACAASLLGLVWALGAAAQDDAYPTRPATIIVPFPAGGSADLNARTVAERLSAARYPVMTFPPRGYAPRLLL